MKTLFDPRSPVFWLGASLAVAILVSNGARLNGRLQGRRGRKPAGVVSSVPPPLAWLLVSLFYLLPPLGAWRFGALSPRLMGLTGIDWIETLRSGAALALLIVGLPIFGWLVYCRSLSGERSRTRAGRAGAVLRALADAALLQWHWAFYRALAIALLPFAAGAPVYWGSWLGLGLSAVEWMLSPSARAGLRQRGPREMALLRVVLAVATTALFTFTANFWLVLVCHIAVETIIAAWLPLPK